MEKLIIDIHYPINTPASFKIDGTIKPECQHDILVEFIRGQMGAGVDSSVPNDHDVYHITIGLDLDGDVFSVLNDNTGNKGLRDGIILDVMRRLEP